MSLPDLAYRDLESVQAFSERALHRGDAAEETSFLGIDALPAHVFRAYFDPAFFTLAEGQSEPSKSQWNTLKKRMKRLHPLVFVLRNYGEIDHESFGKCCYIDFGFFKS